MRSRELTRPSRVEGGRLVTDYEHGGATYAVCDSALNAMLVCELLADEELSEHDKASLLPAMLFADPEAAAEQAGADGYWDMVCDIAWQAFGVDLDGSRSQSREAPVFDLDEDAGRIRASLLKEYGIDWDSAKRSMPYSALCDLIAGLMEAGETPLQQAIYYRTAKPPKQTRHNAEQVRAWRARAEHYRLGRRGGKGAGRGSMEAADAAMASAFASEFRAAERRSADGGV